MSMADSNPELLAPYLANFEKYVPYMQTYCSMLWRDQNTAHQSISSLTNPSILICHFLSFVFHPIWYLFCTPKLISFDSSNFRPLTFMSLYAMLSSPSFSLSLFMLFSRPISLSLMPSSTLSFSFYVTIADTLSLHCIYRCLTWAEGNIVEEMLADVCDPNTGRCHGNVVKVRYYFILITFYVFVG